MGKTVRFTISMPATDFKEIESMRRRTGRTRSQLIRDALRAWMGDTARPRGVKEGAGEYKKETSINLTDMEERRRRALAAAGRFRSGVSDLSSKHDQYLEEAYLDIVSAKDIDKTRRRP